MNQTTRAYLYRASVAVIGVATAYGLVADNKVVPLVALAAAVFPTGLAAKHTPRK